MSILKYISRIQRIDKLIRMKATGSPDKLSKKLGIGKSVLLSNIREMRELGFPIQYDRHKESYIYTSSGKLVIGFENYSLNADANSFI